MKNKTGIIIKSVNGFSFGETIEIIRPLSTGHIQIRKFEFPWKHLSVNPSHVQLTDTMYDCSKNPCTINPSYV